MKSAKAKAAGVAGMHYYVQPFRRDGRPQYCLSRTHRSIVASGVES